MLGKRGNQKFSWRNIPITLIDRVMSCIRLVRQALHRHDGQALWSQKLSGFTGDPVRSCQRRRLEKVGLAEETG